MNGVTVIGSTTSMEQCIDDILSSLHIAHESKPSKLLTTINLATDTDLIYYIESRQGNLARNELRRLRANRQLAMDKLLDVLTPLIRPAVDIDTLIENYYDLDQDYIHHLQQFIDNKKLYIKSLYEYRSYGILITMGDLGVIYIEKVFRAFNIADNSVSVYHDIISGIELARCHKYVKEYLYRTMVNQGDVIDEDGPVANEINEIIRMNKSALRIYLKIVIANYRLDMFKTILAIAISLKELAIITEHENMIDHDHTINEYRVRVDELTNYMDILKYDYSQYVNDYKQGYYINRIPMYTESEIFISDRQEVSNIVERELKVVQDYYNDRASNDDNKVKERMVAIIEELRFKHDPKILDLTVFVNKQFDPRLYINNWSRELTTYGLIVIPIPNYNHRNVKLEMLRLMKNKLTIDTSVLDGTVNACAPYFELFFDGTNLDYGAEFKYTKSIRSGYVDNLVPVDNKIEESYHTDQSPSLEDFALLQGIVFLNDSGPGDSGFSYLERSNQSFNNYMHRTPNHGYRGNAVNVDDVLYRNAKKIKLCIKAGHMVLFDARMINMMMENVGNPCLTIHITAGKP